MTSEAEVQRAMSGALANQPRYVSYPDYKTSEDFPLWLSGYLAKIGNAFGFLHTESDKVEAEVVRSISGKLSVGGALDAYNRLSVAEKANYTQLVARLTEEFVDPNEARKFNDKLDYNKRKKGQSLKDFMMAIKKDMNRYSTMPANVTVAGSEVPNPEKEKQEVKRFRKGMRDPNGKKDSALSRSLRFHLLTKDELTWDHALLIASKIETSNDSSGESEKTESSDSDSDDEVKAACVKSKKKKASKHKSKQTVDNPFIATLSDKVTENQTKIKQIETTQERMTVQMKEAKESMDASLQKIDAKLDLGFSQQNRGYQQGYSSYQQQPRLQFQQKPRLQFQQQPRTQYQQPQQSGQPNTFRARPTSYTYHARTQQPRQGSFGFQRQTPTSYAPSAQPRPNTPNPQSTTSMLPSTAAKATGPPPAVAAMEDAEIKAEPLFAVEEEPVVTMKYDEFMQMQEQAGMNPDEYELAAAFEQWNFQ